MTRPFTRVAFLIMGPLLAWLGCFAAIYVLGAVSCVRSLVHVEIAGISAPGAAAALLLLLTAAFTGWQLLSSLRQRRRGDQNARFTHFLALSLAALALMGLVLLAMTTMLVRPACAGQPDTASTLRAPVPPLT